MGGAQHQAKTLRIRLYGPPLFDCPGTSLPAGQRTIGLLALLATAPEMRRTRSWLTAHLWSDLPADRARANLRQVLHALRQALGAAFDELFKVTRDTIALRSERVELLGSGQDGAFLEGLDLGDEAFEDWLRDVRQACLDNPQVPARAARAAEVPTSRSRPVDPPDPEENLLPRVMVRPFAELAAQPGLGDALAQEVAAHFARSQTIDAISHYSSRSGAMTLGEDGLTDFAVTGTCRLSGALILLDAALVEIGTGKILWADRLQDDLGAFLAGQDKMTAELAGQVIRILSSRSIAETSSRPLPELKTHMLMLGAVSRMHSFEPRLFSLAGAQLEEVIARCPEASLPRAWLAQWHLLRLYQKWTETPAEDRKSAIGSIANALDMNGECPLSLVIDGNIHTILLHDFATARRRFDAARAINPSSAFHTHIESVLATFDGQGARAVELTDRAQRLSPRDSRRPFFQTLSAGSFVAGGRYREAAEMAEASIRYHPQHLSAHRCRVIALQLEGRAPEARAAARELMARDPSLRVSDYLRSHPAGGSEPVKNWANALRQAGVPEN